ncbi:HTTM domain-containing protein [Mesonia sp. K7]|uniref:HTTM domain-containing protein n=1 Tax=Mesonia sp. K7 TaxID=2218606 RepID=UPI000DA9DB7D|nr:HTTM domain-containing protein [Mesonia sp. K7]PZD78503.1 hypothetical protein DNG35_05425 [Mesonia sp. K7]
MIDKWFFKQVDNSALIVFRIFFGILITLEAWGAIASGWVRRTLVEPQQTFNFIGFDFLQIFVGPQMYIFYAVLGLFGVFVMLGYRYKFSMAMYTVMWTITYLLQKSSYNNHYYLLILICIFMLIVPAHRYFSLDAKRQPSLKAISCPNWIYIFIILQLFIVYTYASVAKWYPDWLDFSVAKMLMQSRADYWLVGDLLQQHWAHVIITYFGILFDLLVVPLLLWKPTRKPIFIFGIFFHLFNSIVFQIGIFPYLSLAFCLFFFPVKTIHKNFLRRKPFYDKNEIIIPNYKPYFIPFVVAWFIIQVTLPLRHWLIKGDVLWTEEGHRLSWRMMLRSKSGITSFRIVDKETGKETYVNRNDYLTNKQIRTVSTKPDCMWQFAQRLKKEYAEQGKAIEVYVNARVSVNQKPHQQLIDPKVDLAAAEWNYFWHNNWVLLPEEEKEVKK